MRSVKKENKKVDSQNTAVFLISIEVKSHSYIKS